MKETIGARMAALRKEKSMKQDELADIMGVSPQAVSKWENDQTYPDILLLSKLAQTLGVTVDELLNGKQQPVVRVEPPEERKDRILRLIVDSAAGDKVRMNLPVALIRIFLDSGTGMIQSQGGVEINGLLRDIDWEKIMALIDQGMVGDLLEVQSANGDNVRIFVE